MSQRCLPDIGRLGASAHRQACETPSRPIRGGCPCAFLYLRDAPLQSDAHARLLWSRYEPGDAHRLHLARVRSAIARIRTRTHVSPQGAQPCFVPIATVSKSIRPALLSGMMLEPQALRPASSQGSLKPWQRPIRSGLAHRILRFFRKLRRPVKPHARSSSCLWRGSSIKTPVETRYCQRGAYIAHTPPKSGAAYLHIGCADSAQHYVANFDAKTV